MPISQEKRKLLEELANLVLEKPGPSAYLSALYDEGSIEDIKHEIAKHKKDKNQL
jgi:hypothetical protein